MWAQTPDTVAQSVLALCDDLVRQGIDLAVREEDEMYQIFLWGQGGDRDRGLAMYFTSGRALWQTIEPLLRWRFGDPARIARLLDFASGYGRLTRFLELAVPPERIWVADIQPEAVRAQEEQFGVHGILSSTEPDELVLEGSFDVILVSSLFTHLPAATFRAWLARLTDALRPGGVLLLSVHDVALLGDRRAGQDFLFEPVSETVRLSTADYGSAWVSEGFVRQTLAEVLPGASVRRFERGFANLQDLYVVVPEADAALAGITLPRIPDTFVESCEFDGARRLHVQGWVADRLTRERPVRVELRLDGALLVSRGAAELLDRQDVLGVVGEAGVPATGFALWAPLAEGVELGAFLEVIAVLASGERLPILACPLGEALLSAVRMDRKWLHDEIRQLEPYRERCRDLERQLGDRDRLIAAMEASRFWRLRRAWFTCKRALGLTDER